MTEIARSRARAALPAALLVLAAGFASLGVWQLDRQAWKHDLIAAIASRANAPPSPAPDAATETDAYRRIELTGHYRHDQETLVRAAFSHAGDNQVRAARVLGVTRNTLRTLLKRYGLLGAAPAAPHPAVSKAPVPLAH